MITKSSRIAATALFACLTLAPAFGARAGDGEFTGKFDAQLLPDREGREHVVFKPVRDRAKLKFAEPVEADAGLTVGWLYDARSDKSAIMAALVEPEGEEPFLLVDTNLDGAFGAGERVEFDANDNPYEKTVTIMLPLAGGPFATYPQFVRLLRNVKWDGMEEGQRLLLESRAAFATGVVDLAGRKTRVQYGYNAKSKKVDVMNGSLGVDTDGDGEIDVDRFSSEWAEANAEAVIFRVGDLFVSTKRADVEKNLITMRSHAKTDYKRVEIGVGREMPDFEFTDFDGKKHRFVEYRGKYVLIDFWGMWCPPCRGELPYLKAAYSRFQPRGFEIVGMNTDEVEAIGQVKSTLKQNGMDWTQAKRDSIEHVIRALRISSFPTTILVGPDGKILSLNNTDKGQPSLRGQELLQSLDKIMEP